ncbi:MAG: RpiB/LacA/LacB family sugar-phosphate isomerase [Planctomycetota bacterium]
MSRPLVTVKTLLAQVRDKGRIELPQDALVTPAAADWLQASHLPVSNGRVPQQASAQGPIFYLVGDTSDPCLQALRSLLERRHPTLAFVSCQGCRQGLFDAIDTVAQGLKECSRRRAVLAVSSPAICTCVANKYPHVRAACLTRPSELRALLSELGANVLVLENGSLSLHQMQATIDAFFTGKTSLEPLVEAALRRVAAHPPPPESKEG